MKRKLECQSIDVERLLAVGLAAEGKKVVSLRWTPLDPGSVDVEYELLPSAPDTAEKPDLKAVLIEKLALLMEQCQLGGLDFYTEVLDVARLKFSNRAASAGRMDP